MKKTIGFAVVCSSMLIVGQVWAFGGGAGPGYNNPEYGYGSGNSTQQPYAGNQGYGQSYDPSRSGNTGSGAGFGGGPQSQQYGPGYGGYQQAAPGGYNTYQQSPQGYTPPQGYGYQQQAPEEYDIPRDAYGQQYQPGQGGYQQGQPPAYSGYPGYGYPPRGYPRGYYRDREDRKSGGFPNPMNMMKSPMNMFGGGKDRD